MNALHSVARLRWRIFAVFALVYVLIVYPAPKMSWAQSLDVAHEKETTPPPAIINEIAATPPKFDDEKTPEDEQEKIISSPPPNFDGSGKAAGGDDLSYVERSEDSQLIVELLVDNEVLDPGVIVYMLDEDILVPLSVFTELLGFPITVDTASGQAEGWFIKPENKFSLKYPFKKIILENKESNTKGGIIELHLDDIYVSTSLISQWFPIALNFNYNELRLYMTAREDLPFQQRAKRRAKWKSTKANQTMPGFEIEGPIIKLPHRMLAAPAIQMNDNFTFTKSSSGQKQNGSNHSLQAQGDLFKMDARLGLSYARSSVSTSEIQNFNFNLSRQDFDEKMLGRLKATEISLGDVNALTFPLAGSSNQGRGVTLDNRPFNFIRDPNNFRITGDAPVGWDVEVYQNQSLLDFQTVDNDGKYDFETLALREGFNLFRIILYGPNGERQERSERFYLGQNMIEPGQFIYEFNALQSSTPMFDFSTAHPEETPHTISALGEYGVNKYLSIYGGVFDGPLSSGTLKGFGTGVNLSTENAFSQINYFRDESGGTSSSALLTGNLTENISLTARHTVHQNYNAGMRGTPRETLFQYAQSIPTTIGGATGLGYTLSAKRTIAESGLETKAYGNRLSASFFGLNVSNEMEYKSFNNASADTWDGKLTLRYRSRIGTIRSRLSYTLRDKAALDSSDIQMQTQLSQNIFMNTTLTSQLSGIKSDTLDLGLDWRLDKIRLGINGSASTLGERRVGVNMAYNFIPRALYGDYEITGAGDELSSGRVVIKPFLDKNKNGQWDEGEQLLGGVLFKNMLRGTKATSTPEGSAALSGLSPNIVNRISIDAKTLPDIYMSPVDDTINILGKSGVNGPVYFPISQLGEISGTLTTRNAMGEEITLADVQILLLDENEKVVGETYSESDGFYTLPALPMGKYEMFFPNSEGLNQYYTGDGEGPSFTLEPDTPEISDGDIHVLPTRIIFKADDDGSRSSIMKEIKFFALNLNNLIPLNLKNR